MKDKIYRISVQPEYGSHVFWIKQIEDDYSGILFSDGTFTAGQKHCTKAVREWLAGCERRKKAPTFRFAPDEPGADGGFKDNILYGCNDEACMDKKGKSGRDDMIFGQIIRKAAKEIIRKHNRSFGGSLTDTETMKQAGISRKSFYKYKKELWSER